MACLAKDPGSRILAESICRRRIEHLSFPSSRIFERKFAPVCCLRILQTKEKRGSRPDGLVDLMVVCCNSKGTCAV
jgi:hypothetical protein